MGDKIPNPIPKKSMNALLYPAFSQIGTATGDILKGLFNLTLTPLRKYNITKDADFKDFAERTNNHYAKIPEENVDLTKKSLTAKVIDDSKFRLDETYMREIFARLVAKTMDSRYNERFYPIYSSILANMSPTEAQLLIKIKDNQSTVAYETANLNTKNSAITREAGVDFVLICGDVPILNKYNVEIDLLSRSGLITTTRYFELSHPKYKKQYQDFENSQLAEQLKQTFAEPNRDFVYNRGKIALTNLGESFVGFIAE